MCAAAFPVSTYAAPTPCRAACECTPMSYVTGYVTWLTNVKSPRSIGQNFDLESPGTRRMNLDCIHHIYLARRAAFCLVNYAVFRGRRLGHRA